MAVDEIDIDGGSGIATSLRVIYRDAAGKVGNAATGSYETWSDGNYANYQVGAAASANPITEEGTSAHYLITRPAWVTSPGSVKWIEVVGGTPTTDLQQGLGALDDAADGITTETGSQLPATRRLPFKLKVAGAFTDPTGNTVSLRDPTQTFGVRRQSTGATVVGVSPLQTYTRTGPGIYYYEVPETGLVYEYGAEFVHPVTGDTERVLLTSVPPSIHYASVQDMYDELGADNANIAGNLSSSGANEDSPVMIEDSLRQSDGRVNRKLALASPPPAAFPVTSTAAWVTDDIRTAATKYAAGFLLNKRDRQSAGGKPHGRDQLSAGDLLIADGDDILQGVVDAGLIGVTTGTDPGGVPGLTNLAPAGAGLNACDPSCTCLPLNHLLEPVL